ncbi:MAG: S8 family serine peptidase [Marmoricola sp.]
MIRGSRRTRVTAIAALTGLALFATPITGPAQAGPTTTAPTYAVGKGSDSGTGHVGWWYDKLKVGRAHAEATGAGVTVAVIDGSIDPSVAELQGVDLTRRVDCDGNRVPIRSGSLDDHGTLMSALIAGTGRGNGPGGAGVRGIAPDAKLLFYGIDTAIEPGAKLFYECDGYNSPGLVRDAVKRGADVISISIGGLGGDWFKRALKAARDKGAVVVASSGDASANGLGVESPARFPGVVAVNAVDRNAKPWRYNPAVSIVRKPIAEIKEGFPVISAPGVDLKTLRWRDGGWHSDAPATGTSPATALVSGALALVKQKYPEATGNQLIQNLIHFTGGTRAYSFDREYGFGIVSLEKMLDHDPTGWPDENPLLKGPAAAVKDYPMSAYQAPSPSPAAQTPSASPAPSAAPPPSAAQSEAESDGPAAGLWFLIGAGVLVVGAAVVFISFRRRRSPASLPSQSEV